MTAQDIKNKIVIAEQKFTANPNKKTAYILHNLKTDLREHPETRQAYQDRCAKVDKNLRESAMELYYELSHKKAFGTHIKL